MYVFFYIIIFSTVLKMYSKLLLQMVIIFFASISFNCAIVIIRSLLLTLLIYFRHLIICILRTVFIISHRFLKRLYLSVYLIILLKYFSYNQFGSFYPLSNPSKIQSTYLSLKDKEKCSLVLFFLYTKLLYACHKNSGFPFCSIF